MAGVRIRLYRPDDEQEVKRIFSEGMWSTLTHNIRKQYFRTFLGIGVLLASITRQLSEGFITSVSILVITLFLLFLFFPTAVATSYIRRSLASDLKDISCRYRCKDGKYAAFYVAEDKETGQVCPIKDMLLSRACF